jgi:GntR family transcriptional regulator
LARQAPALYHREYVIAGPAQSPNFPRKEEGILPDFFEPGGNKVLKRGKFEIGATLLDPEEAGLLGCPLPAAGVRVEHLFYDFDDRPTNWGWFVAHADRLHFEAIAGLSPLSDTG